MHKPYILKNIINRISYEDKKTFEYNYDKDINVTKDNGLPLIDEHNNFLHGRTSTEFFPEEDDFELNILGLYTKTFNKDEHDDDPNMFF